MFKIKGDDGSLLTVHEVSHGKYYSAETPVEIFVNGHGGNDYSNYIQLSWLEVDDLISYLQKLQTKRI